MSVKLNSEEFQKLLSTENFSKLYAQFLIEMPEYSTEGLREIHGEWVRYEQGSDATELVRSLEGYPLEWCTANYDTANTQLHGGDFHVYYSLNQDGEPKIPRLAIRMEGDRIAEPPRGIAPDQNLDPFILPKLQEKLTEFGAEGEAFVKRTADMELLSAIQEKTEQGQELTKEELVFLYEIDAQIEGFGYPYPVSGKCSDPRIAELRSTRNLEEDASVVFECEPSQIAHNAKNITPDTKIYVGPLVPGIFQMLPEGIEHIYTSFPGKPICQDRDTVEIGGMSREELLQKLEEKGIGISDMITSEDFTTGEKPETVNLVWLTVKSLGFRLDATTDKIYKRAEELGLELCSVEMGLRYRLKYENQPMNEWRRIGMKPIADWNDSPGFFGNITRSGDVLGLADGWARPKSSWDSEDQFAFRLPARPAGGRKQKDTLT